jgi:betaine-aldehyde dehydrogenase
MIQNRLAQLELLADVIHAEAPRLEAAAVETLTAPRRVIRDDIALTVHRLRAFRSLAWVLDGRKPIGTVALCIAGNAILSNPVTAIATSYVAGNSTIARFPRRRAKWAAIVADLVERTFGDAVTWPEEPGPTFVNRVLRDAAADVLMAFGGDEWGEYEELARSSRVKVIFEGPGKDPFLVLDGANVPAAARAAVRAGCYNAGQACTAPERFYVIDELFDAFVDHLVAEARRVRVGPADDPETQVGALDPGMASRVESQITDAVAKGAFVLSGGADGTLISPTVVVEVNHDMELMQQETFGPVMPVMRVANVDRAVELADDSSYGLSATVFGGPQSIRDQLGRTHGVVYFDESWLDSRWNTPLAPYGGRRRSGWVWEWIGDTFVHRDGPRQPVTEFSRAIASC